MNKDIHTICVKSEMRKTIVIHVSVLKCKNTLAERSNECPSPVFLHHVHTFQIVSAE